MAKWIKPVIILGTLAAVTAGVVWYVRRDEEVKVTYRTVPVAEAYGLKATIGATGTLQPEETVDVGAQVAGQIIAFGTDARPVPQTVDNNSPVKQNALLAQIDPSVYQQNVNSAKAQKDQADAGLTRARADLKQLNAKKTQADNDWARAQLLGPSSDALSKSDYDQLQAAALIAAANVEIGAAAIEQAVASVKQADSTLEKENRNLAFCTINAPVDGTVIARRVNIGQTVVSSLNAPSLFLLAKDLTKMQIWASVNEADIGSVWDGQDVTFTVDAFPGREFGGTVKKVRYFAQMTQNVVTYTVEVTVDNRDLLLRPYLTANAQFIIAKRDEALTVPNAALRWTPTSTDQIAPDARDQFASPAGGGPRRGGGAGGGGSGGGTGSGGGAGGGGKRREGGRTTGPSTNPATRPAGTPQNRHGMVWVQAGAFVKPVRVLVGITDGVNTEISGDGVTKDLQVVIGETRTGGNATADARNPFLPQFGGGNRGAGGGGGARGGGR